MSRFLKKEDFKKRAKEADEVFIFLAGLNFWEGLFDNVNIRFISNLLSFKLADFPAIVMTIITPHRLSHEKANILKEKEELLKKIAVSHGVNIEFCHVRGRTIPGLFAVAHEICRKTSFYRKRFIWASNYFNAFLGSVIKHRFPDTYLHFEMMGLVPEEELLYSESFIALRMIKFLTLRMLCRINLKRTNSVTVVSKRFKDYVICRYRLNPSTVNVLPCFYDDKLFYVDDELRKKFRLKYQIHDHQRLLLYSGMLQKWQLPDVLFGFFKNVQQQDKNNELRLMVITFDPDKARHFASAYGIKDLMIDTLCGTDLNGVYNAADIGISTRSEDWASKVSSPVKIPEYLATKNSLILLESIGDFGMEMKHKQYALVKKNKEHLLNTNLSEIRLLEKPDTQDMADIFENYSGRNYLPIIKKILDQRHNPEKLRSPNELFPLYP